MLVLAGAGALLVSVPVAIAISVLLAVVAISYRQVCNAFPGGGGAYAVARQELRPILGLVAAAALLIDYVMTVAVSTSSAMDQLISILPGLDLVRLEVAVAVIALITIANLRGLRESGNIFAVPTYLFVSMALVIVASGLIHIVDRHRDPAPAAVPGGGHGHRDARHRADPAGVRERLGRPDRRGGDRQRRAGVQAPGGEERGQHDARDGRPAGRHLHRRHGHRPRVRHRPVRPAVRRPDGHRPRGPDRVRIGHRPVLPLPGGDGADPVPRGQHELQRLPAPRGDPGRGRVLPAPVLVPRRPPRLQLGDHPPGRHRGRPVRRIPGQHDEPDPALLGRRVRLLHPEPERHGRPLVPRAGTRAGAGG